MQYNDDMNPTVQALRAIAARFARQVYIPLATISGTIFIGLIIFSVWLTTYSGWWWILFAFIVIAGLVTGFALLVAGVIIMVVTPNQTIKQKQRVKSFVEKLQHLSEVAQTPKFILLFRLVRDTARPREHSYIESVSKSTKTLRSDFMELVDLFR